jgi:hypothetical protein
MDDEAETERMLPSAPMRAPEVLSGPERRSPLKYGGEAASSGTEHCARFLGIADLPYARD